MSSELTSKALPAASRLRRRTPSVMLTGRLCGFRRRKAMMRMGKAISTIPNRTRRILISFTAAGVIWSEVWIGMGFVCDTSARGKWK